MLCLKRVNKELKYFNKYFIVLSIGLMGEECFLGGQGVSARCFYRIVGNKIWKLSKRGAGKDIKKCS